MVRNGVRSLAATLAFAGVLLFPGCRKHKYESPITKDTQQPDKVLFDTAVDDIEHSRFERARLTLNTLMNTYDTSEYMAKAKLAIADSWFKEGGAHGFAQAEAEYKDFILFYPTMPEAAESQVKICKMQYQQMDKSDRDPAHALRAEDECKQVLLQFPNSPFAPEAKQMLLNIQEVLADREYKVGFFYHHKGGAGFYSSAARLQAVTDQYPLYSQADEALWLLGDDYSKMGDKFDNQQAAAYTRIVRDYPLSPHVTEAKAKLQSMNRPVPEADQVALNRMKYDQENRQKRSLLAKAWGPFAQHPNTVMAARSGDPTMQSLRPLTPASVPPTAAGVTGTNEITVSNPVDPKVLEEKPEARAGGAAPAAGTAAPAGGTATPAAGGTAAPAAGAPAAPGTAGATTGAGTATPAASGAAANAAGTTATVNGKKVKQDKPKKPKRSKKDTKTQTTTDVVKQ
jgi:outer membrane protein assembly factor BamD